MDEFLGSIKQFGFSWAPRDWQLCHGQVLAIQSNTALFALLGTNFGGNGVSTFALPDLRAKRTDGSYYLHGEIMTNGLPYLESSICTAGVFPSRP